MLLAALEDHIAKELDFALHFWSDQDEEQDGCMLIYSTCHQCLTGRLICTQFYFNVK